jgi:hypothetical protein
VLVLLAALAAGGAVLAVLTTNADRLMAAVMAGAAILIMTPLTWQLARTVRALPRAAGRQLPRLLWASRAELLPQRSWRLLRRRFRHWRIR